MDDDFDADFDEPIDWRFKETRFDLSGLDPLQPLIETTLELCLVRPAKKFLVNMIRVRSIHDGIVDIAGMVMAYQEAATRLDHQNPPFKTVEEFNAAVELEYEKRLEKAKRDKSTAEKETKLHQDAVYHALDRWHSIYINMGMRGVMQNFIVALWASMEVLLSELIVSIAKEYPTLFSRDYSTFSIQKLESFHAVYEEAFQDKNINRIIQDQCIDALFLTRNVFGHELGVVDEFAKGRFKERYLTKWAELPEGKQFPIHGGIVKDYAERNIKQAVLLIKALDEWIKMRNPPSP